MMLPKVHYRSSSQQSDSAVSTGSYNNDYVSNDDSLHKDSSALALARANQLLTPVMSTDKREPPILNEPSTIDPLLIPPHHRVHPQIHASPLVPER